MYVYAIGALFVLVAWTVLYLVAPKCRPALLWSGLAWGLAGPISEYWHSRDYWSPDYLVRFQIGNWSFGVEDYVYAFAFAGLCAGIFDLLQGKKGPAAMVPQFTLWRFLLLELIVGVCLGAMACLSECLGMNSVHAITIVFVLGGLAIMIRRPVWILVAIVTACVAGCFMWLFYWGFFFRLFPHVLDRWWQQQALSGILLRGVPIEEVAWACAAGWFAGPVFRLCADVSLPHDRERA